MPRDIQYTDHHGVPTLIETAPVAVGATLRLMRERRGLQANQVALWLDRSPAFVSKAENDLAEVSGPVLTAYAQQLSVTTDLLCQHIPVEPAEGVHFRSNKVPQKTRTQVIAHANYIGWLLNRIHDGTGADTVTDLLELPGIDADLLDGGAGEAAQMMRRRWRQTGPIRDIARLLERAGVFIVPMPRGVLGIDAVTVRTRGPVTAVILLAIDMPEDRKRHTLAHELAHLVLDQATGSVSLKGDEERADAFAGEFLAPYDELRHDLRDITPAQLDALEGLRAHWGVSLHSLIRRAYLHHDINESQYRYWFRVLNARKGSLAARDDFYFPVHPTGTRDFLATMAEHKWSVASLCGFTHTDVRDLEDVFGDQWPFSPSVPTLSRGLHLVQSV